MNVSRKWALGALGAAALLVAALTGGTAFAQGTAQNTATTSPLAPPTPGMPMPSAGRDGVQDEYLAAALGITVDELDAAQQEAQTAALADAVADGTISAEDAALRQARSALQAYLAEPMQAAYEAAVAAAVSAGVITQAQADVFLAEDWNQAGRGGFGGGPAGGPPDTGGQSGHGQSGAPPAPLSGSGQMAPPQQP